MLKYNMRYIEMKKDKRTKIINYWQIFNLFCSCRHFINTAFKKLLLSKNTLVCFRFKNISKGLFIIF